MLIHTQSKNGCANQNSSEFRLSDPTQSTVHYLLQQLINKLRGERDDHAWVAAITIEYHFTCVWHKNLIDSRETYNFIKFIILIDRYVDCWCVIVVKHTSSIVSTLHTSFFFVYYSIHFQLNSQSENAAMRIKYSGKIGRKLKYFII